MAASNNQLRFVIFAMILVSCSISVVGDLESAFIVAHEKATLTKLINGVYVSPFLSTSTIVDLFLDLLKNDQVVAIIGPETSPEAQFVVNLGEKARDPIVSYSPTSPSLSPTQNSYFIRAAQDDSCQVQPISDLIQDF